MKKSILSAAILAAATVSFSQATFAHAPSVVPDLEIWMSGATAQDKNIENLFDNNCVAGTKDVFRNAGSNPGNAHRAIFCTVDSTKVSGLSKNGVGVATAKVLFHKRSQGGSAQGVNPLIDGVAIDHMVINNTVGGVPNCTLTATANEWTCLNTRAGDLAPRVSDMGASDVEPTLFFGPNKPSNAKAVTQLAASNALRVEPAAALVFGIPVNDPLYIALQYVEGLLTTAPAGVTPGTCAPGDYTEACMPSLTKQQVAELLSGQIKKWDEFTINGVNMIAALTAAGLQYTDSEPGSVPRNVVPNDTKVHVCKRIDGSGTGAVTYANFLHSPCTSAGLSPDFPGSAINGPVRNEVSGSGDIETCLEDFADGEANAKQITTVNPDVFNTPANTAGNRAWALGMQSLENNVAHTKHYRFIKINGVAPTLANAFKGKYEDWAEVTFQIRKNLPNDPITGFKVDKEAVFNNLVSDVASPAVLGVSNFNHPFGLSGYLAIGTVHPFTDTLNPALPVMPYSHAVVGALNNCQVPVIPASSKKKPIMGF
jgi:ABC-type phosphate transport system substrate-binding protein